MWAIPIGTSYVLKKNQVKSPSPESRVPETGSDPPIGSDRESGRDSKKSKEPLQLVHNNICGPLSVQTRGGYEYFVTFIDDYSRYAYVYLMHKKSKTFGKFKEFMAEAEKQLGKSLKNLRPDRGGE